MIARIRGEHDSGGRWRVRPPSTTPAILPELDSGQLEVADARSQGTLESVVPRDEQRAGIGRALRWAQVILVGAVLLAMVSVAYVAGDWVVDQFSAAPPASPSGRTAIAPAPLPRSPRAWLDAYESAAIDNPHRVCSQLLSPGLAAAYGRAVHASCASYFARVSSSSLTIRRIFIDGAAAVLELRQTVGHADWAVVLSRRPDGWQAVDLLAGDLLR